MISEALLSKTAELAVKMLVEKVISPKIDAFKKGLVSSYNEYMIPRREHFEEYLIRSYKKYSVINTLVFKNEQRLLTDLYVPLTIVKGLTDTHDKEETVMDQVPLALFKQYRRMLITDTAGMGKSTITKYLFLQSISEGVGIPIYIELRRLSKENDILKEIQTQLNALNKEFDSSLLLDFINKGGFLFFFDGYDEIAISERTFVIENIQEFISKASDNYFIMTSRPEVSLSCFGDFQSFSIKPLTNEQAFELLKKYDSSKDVSKSLIAELKTGRYTAIDEFLTNPLLVSLLFAAYDYKHTIPLKKNIFYRQVYDAYFDSHDLSKGGSYIHEKKTGLDIDEFSRVLRHVAYECLRLHKIEFEKDALLTLIETARNNCPDLKFSTSDFMYDLLTSVPLFCKDGNYYRWVHKSLQEYFAALFIYNDSKTGQDAILSALYYSKHLDQYMNLIDIYSDIDSWGFRVHFILPLIEEFISFYRNNYFENGIISPSDVKDRLNILFLSKICIIQIDKSEKQKAGTFDIIREKTSDKIIMERAGYSHVDDLAFACSYNPKLKLLFFLENRRPELFDDPSKRSDYPISGMLAKDSVVFVTPHSADLDKNLYSNYNNYLRQMGDFPLLNLNPERCEDEITVIENYLHSKSETSSLVAGL